MQLTLRDCFWATLVVGLTIGLVVERNDVLALRGVQEKAGWWQESAENMKQILERHGFSVDLDESRLKVLDSRGFFIHQSGVTRTIRNWQVTSFLTGHVEFDWVLVIGASLVVLVAIVLFILRRRIAERMAQPIPQFKPYRDYVLGCFSVAGIVMFGVMAFFSYQNRQPFTGAFYFCFVGLHILNLKRQGFRLHTPERAARQTATLFQPFPWTDLFKWD